MKKLLILFSLICGCSSGIQPPCSYWTVNVYTKYPAFVESKAIRIESMDDLMYIMNECKVVNIIRVDGELYAITE